MNSDDPNSLLKFIEYIRQVSPGYLDLFTATNFDEFEDAFTKILERAISHLETNKRNFSGLPEETLSAILAGVLMIPGVHVSPETNSNGHVDLMIEIGHCTPRRVKLGEAKIYRGPEYHIKGIGQLLGRYTTGRETQGFIISYVFQRNIKSIVTKLKTELDKQLPENQTCPAQDHVLRWSLLTRHKHSSGEELGLSHIGCNLFVEE
jgi:hypothetical protein